MKKNKNNFCIGVIGLGYVGLPLATRLSLKYRTYGYDIDKIRVDNLKKNIDTTFELSKKELRGFKNLRFYNSLSDLYDCNVYILTLPTPINKNNKPDLSILKSATKDLSQLIKKDDIVIYESTVFPGVTEDICMPIIEKYSKLKFNVDFFAGYSPERINPGDHKRKIHTIKKIVSGSNKKTLNKVDEIYSKIITAGTHRVKSIKIAEAAKVIENTQRDLNIALINELSIIFDKMNLETDQIINAASTKWNFIPFSPGLVGGHCIGVDPYYLTYRSQQLGYRPKVILAGRSINDGMANYVGKKLFEEIKKIKNKEAKLKVLILGYTFKENCPDIRNTKVRDVVNFFIKKNVSVDIYDPWVQEYDKKILENKINFLDKPRKNYYDGILIAVGHSVFMKNGIKMIKSYGKKRCIIHDFKKIF
jgi:UDP-N-acetyl-D-galactosamine dehydrogenase